MYIQRGWLILECMYALLLHRHMVTQISYYYYYYYYYHHHHNHHYNRTPFIRINWIVSHPDRQKIRICL